MSFLADLFGGGSKKAAQQLQQSLEQAEQQISGATERGLGFLDPFRGAGEFAIPRLEQLFGEDPTALISRIGAQYQESPFQKFQSQQAQKAMQNQLAGAGLSGSGEAIQRSGALAQQQAGQGQEQFLRDVLGARQQQIGGLQGLFGGGLSAAGTGAGLLGQEGQELAGLTSQIGQAQAAGTLGRQQSLANLFGGLGQIGGLIGSGGMSGLMNLFGVGGASPWMNPDTGIPFQPGGFAPQFGF